MNAATRKAMEQAGFTIERRKHRWFLVRRLGGTETCRTKKAAEELAVVRLRQARLLPN